MRFVDGFLDWFMMSLMPVILCLMIVGLIIGVPILIYCEYVDFKSPTFTLKKSQWECTSRHNYTTTISVLVGNVIIPQQASHSECVQWSHK